jgi:hypothetical protein
MKRAMRRKRLVSVTRAIGPNARKQFASLLLWSIQEKQRFILALASMLNKTESIDACRTALGMRARVESEF